MKKGNSLKAVVLTALLTVLVSCAGSPGMKIGNTVTICCPGDYATYQSYGIEAVTLPLFLRDYAVAQFDTAFQEKGLARNDQRSELIVNLAYRHVNLNPDQQTIDPFIRMQGGMGRDSQQIAFSTAGRIHAPGCGHSGLSGNLPGCADRVPRNRRVTRRSGSLPCRRTSHFQRVTPEPCGT